MGRRTIEREALGPNAALGPAPKQKIYHFAAKIRADGAVSALCFRNPRPIRLDHALWTNREEAVTRKTCRQMIEARRG